MFITMIILLEEFFFKSSLRMTVKEGNEGFFPVCVYGPPSRAPRPPPHGVKSFEKIRSKRSIFQAYMR